MTKTYDGVRVVDKSDDFTVQIREYNGEWFNEYAFDKNYWKVENAIEYAQTLRENIRMKQLPKDERVVWEGYVRVNL